MSGLPLIIVFILAIVVMIFMISKFKIHPFVSIMCISLVLGLIAGIPIVDVTLDDGSKQAGIATVAITREIVKAPTIPHSLLSMIKKSMAWKSEFSEI